MREENETPLLKRGSSGLYMSFEAIAILLVGVMVGLAASKISEMIDIKKDIMNDRAIYYHQQAYPTPATTQITEPLSESGSEPATINIETSDWRKKLIQSSLKSYAEKNTKTKKELEKTGLIHADSEQKVLKEDLINAIKVGNKDRLNTISRIAQSIKKEWVLNYDAENETNRVFVFTDYTCPYCRKLHKIMPELNKQGISISYLFYPRSFGGENKQREKRDLENFKNVWCSDDPKASLDRLFNRQSIEASDCTGKTPDPTREHLLLGDMLEVKGTPHVFDINGIEQEGFRGKDNFISIFK